MGYSLFETLAALGPTEALVMAIKDRKAESVALLIHHSERGVQYCSADYVRLLTPENISISMTQNGSPYENALAERINGTIKNDFFRRRCTESQRSTKGNNTNVVKNNNRGTGRTNLFQLTL